MVHELTKQQEGTFYTVSASFLNDSSRRQYTYKVLNGIECAEGDFAIVETNSGYKLVTVIKIHDIPAIDYNVNYEYRWIVDTVQLNNYIEIQQNEKAMKKHSATWEF